VNNPEIYLDRVLPNGSEIWKNAQTGRTGYVSHIAEKMGERTFNQERFRVMARLHSEQI
jgi:hypothetical protein